MGVQDAFVGIDVAFAKRKPLPVSVCVTGRAFSTSSRSVWRSRNCRWDEEMSRRSMTRFGSSLPWTCWPGWKS